MCQASTTSSRLTRGGPSCRPCMARVASSTASCGTWAALHTKVRVVAMLGHGHTCDRLHKVRFKPK
jgi:hypothetical protein